MMVIPIPPPTTNWASSTQTATLLPRSKRPTTLTTWGRGVPQTSITAVMLNLVQKFSNEKEALPYTMLRTDYSWRECQVTSRETLLTLLYLCTDIFFVLRNSAWRRQLTFRKVQVLQVQSFLSFNSPPTHRLPPKRNVPHFGCVAPTCQGDPNHREHALDWPMFLMYEFCHPSTWRNRQAELSVSSVWPDSSPVSQWACGMADSCIFASTAPTLRNPPLHTGMWRLWTQSLDARCPLWLSHSPPKELFYDH